MAKQKKKLSAKAKKEAQKLPVLEISTTLPNRIKYLIIAALVIISAGLSIYYILYALGINKENGFPLDDPWIHLTFARNLIDYHSFSYFKNEIVTAGSTSPLYTLILAVGFLITRNEMILSYFLGILFLALSVFAIYKLSELNFPKEYWLIVVCTLFLAIDRWMNFIADSGMETTLCILMLLLCVYFYRKRNAVLFAITFGLLFWVRPDTIAMIGAIIADYILFLIFKKTNPSGNKEVQEFSRKDIIKIGIIFGIILLAYFGMNLKLSGSLMPNTYDAKLTAYTPEYRSRADFLNNEVWQYFIDSYYIMLIVPFIIAVILIFFDVFKKRYSYFLLPLIFIFALVFIYWYKLPYAHRFGRYMMPIIPFYIILFVYGTRNFFIILYNYLKDKNIINVLNISFFVVVIIYSVTACLNNKVLYQDQTRHISIRQVAAAKWLKANTPEDAIIATHDVGAIAYYSERKILDVAGLISPEFIKKLNDADYSDYMLTEMKKEHVSYIAFLREWYRVVNQTPLFTGGDQNFEIMDVYKFDPQKTHILSRYVNSANQYGLELIQNKQIRASS